MLQDFKANYRIKTLIWKRKHFFIVKIIYLTVSMIVTGYLNINTGVALRA